MLIHLKKLKDKNFMTKKRLKQIFHFKQNLELSGNLSYIQSTEKTLI